MKAIGYIRVSTQEQADEGVSLDAQRQKIEAWCMLNDYELVEVYVDAGISGYKMSNRPEFQAAYDAVRKGMALVTYSLSRVSRSAKEMMALLEDLGRRGGDIVSLSEKIDTTSAAGKMVFRMLAVMNEFERDLIVERTTMALAHKKSKGERTGTIPYGYQVHEDGKTLIKHEAEQSILSDIRQLRESGYTLRQIAEQLNEDGLLTRRGSEWKPQYVHNLLKAA